MAARTPQRGADGVPRHDGSQGRRVAAPSPEGAAGGPPPAGGGVVTNRPVLVRDAGFRIDDWSGEYIRWDGVGRLPVVPEHAALDLENTVPAEALTPVLERVPLIRIAFASHVDGRGFSLARALRMLGYRGRLRAAGHVLADQYAMARRSGFDEVEIDGPLAERQPEGQWLYRANWRDNDYQARLRGLPCREGRGGCV